MNKEELIQDGYELLGKYNEELVTYFKLGVINDVPGVNYYFVDNQGNVVGNKKFFSKKDISLAVNIQERVASKQKRIFESKGKRPVRNKRK